MDRKTLDTRGKDAAPPARRPGRRGLVVRLFLVALVSGLLGTGLWAFNEFRSRAIAEFFAGNKPPPTAVAAAPAEVGPQTNTLEGIGSIVAIRQVDVAAEVAGRVTKILFEAGTSVRAGDPLVQLNDEVEKSDLASFEADARLAEANLARTRRLATRDFATQANLDQNRSALERAQAGIARARAQIAQKLITAPFDGQLGIRQVELGQYVGPGTPLVSLTDLDTLYVDFTVPEQMRGAVQPGQQVEVRVDAFPGKVFPAELTTVEPQVDRATRTIKLQATLANPQRLLLPGMFADARIILPPTPDVVTVPETAVVHTLYGDSVFVVRQGESAAEGEPALEAEQVFVRTGAITQGRIAILEGVAAGDMVVSSGSLKLQSGAPVRVVADTALALPAEPPVQ